MRTPIAIIIAAVIIALALLIPSRWEIRAGAGVPVLLDRWSGNVIECVQPPTPPAAKGDTGGFILVPHAIVAVCNP